VRMRHRHGSGTALKGTITMVIDGERRDLRVGTPRLAATDGLWR
jgi:hypothetical protein